MIVAGYFHTSNLFCLETREKQLFVGPVIRAPCISGNHGAFPKMKILLYKYIYEDSVESFILLSTLQGCVVYPFWPC